MAGIASVSGLISGIDTDSIIEQLVAIEKRPVIQYQARQEALKAQKAAYQEANTRLLALQEASRQLAFGSSFTVATASTSKSEVATAVAADGAAPGTYTVTVASVARAHQVLSQGYVDIDSTSIGAGSLSITSGGRTTTVQVTASNNTLGGLRDAINTANTNVRASIVQDGDSSYRLLISAKETGTANAVTVAGDLASGTAPTFSTLQEASDAQLSLGSGANAISVTRSSNAVSDLIPGVTLNLATAAPATPIEVTVSQDVERIVDSVRNLADQYNNVVDFVNSQYALEEDGDGALLADSTLRNIQSDLAGAFTASFSGVPLRDLGITMGADGKLTIVEDTLSDALVADPVRVAGAFALTARSTSAQVQYGGASTRTRVDGSAYAVSITQAARQARVTAGTALTGALSQDEVLTVNRVAIQLTAGMTLSDVVAAVNAQSGTTGARASATGADGTGVGDHLTFTTAAYGGSASVSAVSSRSLSEGTTSGVGSTSVTVATPGGENGLGTSLAGLDVAGTINGEAANGVGQFLVGAAGNAATDGLRLRITATAAGSLGTVTLTDGIANAAYRVLASATAFGGGPIEAQQTSLDDQISDLQEMIDLREDAAERHEAILRDRFKRLETALAELQGQSNFLAAQLSSWQSSSSTSKK